MTKRVNPTEKDISFFAWEAAARRARTRWVTGLRKAATRPRTGMPDGPGMWRPEDRERAHARPPGLRKRAKTAAEMRTSRKSGKLRAGEDAPGMMKSDWSSDDMAVVRRQREDGRRLV